MAVRYGVSQEKESILLKKMEYLGIHEDDIVERFIHSRGHGGQNVNKVSTCVYLKHLPTGIEVKCQKERSQALNRFFCTPYPDTEDRRPNSRQKKRRTTTYCKDQATKTKTLKACPRKGTPPENTFNQKRKRRGLKNRIYLNRNKNQAMG